MAFRKWNPTDSSGLISWIDPQVEGSIAVVGENVTQVDDARGIGEGPSYSEPASAKQFLYAPSYTHEGHRFLYGGTDNEAKTLTGLFSQIQSTSTYSVLLQQHVGSRMTSGIQVTDTSDNSQQIEVRSQVNDLRINDGGGSTAYSFGANQSRVGELHVLGRDGPLGTDLSIRRNGLDVTPIVGLEDWSGVTLEEIRFRVDQNTVPGSNPYGIHGVIILNTVDVAQVEIAEGFLAWHTGFEDRLDSGHPYKNAPPMTNMAASALRISVGISLF